MSSWSIRCRNVFAGRPHHLRQMYSDATTDSSSELGHPFGGVPMIQTKHPPSALLSPLLCSRELQSPLVSAGTIKSSSVPFGC